MTRRFGYVLSVSLVSLSFLALLGLSPSQPSDQAVLRSAIAFTSTRDNPTPPPSAAGCAAEIYLLIQNPNGWEPRRLTWDGISGEAFAALSPDGKKVVFDSNRLALQPGMCPVTPSDLYVMDADGDVSTLKHVIQGSSASWSPDSKNITYHASASGGYGEPILPSQPGSATKDSDIFVLNVDDVVKGVAGPKNLLTNTNPPHFGPAAIDDDPEWHPTLPKIVFTSHYSGEPDHTQAFSADIYVINADGTNLTRLTYNSDPTKPKADQPPGAVEERAPTWSPDGTRILYSCRTKPAPGAPLPPFQLCVMKADGTGQKQLTNFTGGALAPSWSPSRPPDGSSEIVFQRPKVRGTELWTIKLNADDTTGELKQLTNTLGSNFFAHWGQVVLHGAAAR